MANTPTRLEFDTQQLFRDLHDERIMQLRGLYFPEVTGGIQGRYLQARIRINDAAIGEACEAFTIDKGIEVSTDAQKLLDTILNAILSDPHPRWKASPRQRVDILGEYIRRLPDYLASIVEAENVETRITTFDVLHWISSGETFDNLCSIDK